MHGKNIFFSCTVKCNICVVSLSLYSSLKLNERNVLIKFVGGMWDFGRGMWSNLIGNLHAN